MGPRGFEPLTSTMSKWRANQLRYEPKKILVPGEGIEPTRPYGRGILSPVRLPVSPPRQKISALRANPQVIYQEAWTGFEPVNSCFADNSLNHLGTTPKLS